MHDTMKKPRHETPLSARRARSASGADEGDLQDKNRWSSRRKTEVVLRLFREATGGGASYSTCGYWLARGHEWVPKVRPAAPIFDLPTTTRMRCRMLPSETVQVAVGAASARGSSATDRGACDGWRRTPGRTSWPSQDSPLQS
jgi:hypothetical protein